MIQYVSPDHLLSLRKERGLSAPQLDDLADLPPGTCERIHAGWRRVPTDIAAQLAQALGLDDISSLSGLGEPVTRTYSETQLANMAQGDTLPPEMVEASRYAICCIKAARKALGAAMHVEASRDPELVVQVAALIHCRIVSAVAGSTRGRLDAEQPQRGGKLSENGDA